MKCVTISTSSMTLEISQMLYISKQMQRENYQEFLTFLDSLITEQERGNIKDSAASGHRMAG